MAANQHNMLKNLLSKIVKAAVTIGERKLAKTDKPILRRALLFFIGGGEKVILALLDDDKDNAKQLETIVKMEAVEGVNIAAEFGRERVLLFRDRKLANAIMQYIGGTEEVFKALLDENPENEAQIVDIWNRRKMAIIGDGVDIVTDRLAAVIREKIKDPILASIIIELLQEVDNVVKSPT